MSNPLDRVKFGTSGVRALVSDLTDEMVRAYVSAFLRAIGNGRTQIAVGHDRRPSSPAITAAVITELKTQNFDVVYGGGVPTPAIAYAAQQQKIPAIVVTGSHIPFDRNGIKFYSATGEITKEDEENISSHLKLPETISKSIVLPKVNPHVAETFLERYLSVFEAGILQGMRVGLYEHSSAGRELLYTLLTRLGAEVTSLERTSDFVPVDTEAVSDVDREKFKAWSTEHGFDAVVSTDGDADRPLVIDENGDFVPGDILGILTGHFLGIENIVVPVSSTSLVEDSGYFHNVLRTRIGSPYVIEGMVAQADPVAGFEANGGFLLGSDLEVNGRKLSKLMTRDSFLPIISVLIASRVRGINLSAMRQALPRRYNVSDRLTDFPIERSRKILQILETDPNDFMKSIGITHAIIDISTLDGPRFTLSNADIVHLRPSGNAPELRCYVESDSAENASQLLMRVFDVVKQLET